MGTAREKWEKLLTPKRYGRENIQEIDRARSPFVVDHDRIVFSDSFRRLAGKTQVHPLNTNDHVHTRLAHSLEVASVGRGLGTQYGYFLYEKGDLPSFVEPYHLGEIVQSACLAHDIGNPPFGHAGEFAVQEWFGDPQNNVYVRELESGELSDFRSFDGNAQGFRVLNVVENERKKGGFRLSYPTVASVVKYPRSSAQAHAGGSKKFNYYQSEYGIFEEVFAFLGLVKEQDGVKTFLRHPLSYLMEAADDICYRIIDMEDARELGILRYDDILEVIKPIKHLLGMDEMRIKEMYSDRARVSYLRSLVISLLVTDMLRVSREKYAVLMNDGETAPYMEYARDEIRQYMANAKECFYNVILRHPQKISLEIGSYSVYKLLLDVLVPAIYHYVRGDRLSYRETRALHLMGSHTPSKEESLYQAYLAVIDFVTGMTDSYATFLANQFAGSGKN